MGRTRWDSPWLPALVMTAAGVVFVILRLEVAGHGNVSAFILPGANFSVASQLPVGIDQFPQTGYDGQFFYRLATDPAALTGRVHGMVFDTPYRLQRIGYPVLAWLAAWGRLAWVPWSLIAVNVAGLGLLGFIGGLFARDSGRHAAWGLLLSGYWGYVFSLSRDVAEIPAAVFLMGGLLALRRRRPVLAGLSLSASVLTRETGMAVVAAVALVSLVDLVRRGRQRGRGRWGRGRWVQGGSGQGGSGQGGSGRGWGRRPEAVHWAWVLPSACFLAWQVYLRHVVGSVAARADTGANLGRPLVAAVHAVHHDLVNIGQRTAAINLAQIVVLTVLSLFGLWAGLRARGAPWERLAWLLVAGLVLCLSAAVWSGDADLRSMDELFLLDIVLLLASRLPLWIPGALTGMAWIVVAAVQIRSV
jgi:hypothetical protein